MARTTPEKITSLKPDEIFVFGSNGAGAHGGGAARVAHERFGAVWGQGDGLQGQAYGIDTMSGDAVMADAAARFIAYAAAHPELTFLLTPVGCGIAGYRPEQVAPLFSGLPPNVTVPAAFEPYL